MVWDANLSINVQSVINGDMEQLIADEAEEITAIMTMITTMTVKRERNQDIIVKITMTIKSKTGMISFITTERND